MKLLSFSLDTPLGPVRRLGVLDADGERVVDLRLAYTGFLKSQGVDDNDAKRVAACVFPEDMVEFIGLGTWGLDEGRRALEFAAAAEVSRTAEGSGFSFPLQNVHLLAPLKPRVLRDCMAFEEHVRNSYKRLNGQQVPPAWYEMPVYYKGNPHMIVGHDEDVFWPRYSNLMDFELELALIIGPGGRDIPPEKAEERIYGLTIFNDFSARDIQGREMSVGLGPAKGKDFATALGPWIVTLDEIPDLYDLEMTARVNGEVWARGNTRSIYWRFGQIVHHASLSECLQPGDVIGTGTVGGGCGLELGRFLKSGDIVELEISHIGILRNRVLNLNEN